ncbi:hypothetical protein CYMTET_51930 [Cymbomonas tetramitiformis]|uniref:AB hydrolase-1 domain-containing protein n=1 Tax=Cymbomonas tetramitiformis TaxID=36881 RepID=A0AAE0ET75_9CHLO|nr:hypothetical protein CYMTET_51930 [Cymbomonas tetramitiformis]
MLRLCLGAIDVIDESVACSEGIARSRSSLDVLSQNIEQSTRTVEISRSGSGIDIFSPVGLEADTKLAPACTSDLNLESLLRAHDDQVLKLASQSKDAKPNELSSAVRATEILALKHAEVSGWFLGAPVSSIKLGNLEEWLAWAFFHTTPKELAEMIPLGDEMPQLLAESQSWAEFTLEPGYNPAVKSMRLNLDPIPSRHRPLIYYAVTHVVFDWFANWILHMNGFSKHKSGCLTYWRRAGSSGSATEAERAAKLPMVICHGLGVGVLPYIDFARDIIRESAERDVFMITLPNISMQIHEDVPSSTELVVCIVGMLHAWGFSKAHFMGHSFGTAVMAYVAKARPDICGAASFVDPVCFLLCKPDVSFNFMYRAPQNASQMLLKYFVAEELYTAHSLARHFHWQESIVWPEDLKGIPTLVVLSGKDSIVPAHSIRRYLRAFQARDPTCSIKEVLWFENSGHGECMYINRKRRAEVLKAVLRLDGEQAK